MSFLGRFLPICALVSVGVPAAASAQAQQKALAPSSAAAPLPTLESLGSPNPTRIAGPAPEGSQDPAVQLVTLSLPDPKLLDMIGPAFQRGLDQGYARDKALQARYQPHPGMWAFVSQRITDAFVASAAAEMPAFRQSLAAIVRNEMTPQEIADVVAFLASPTNQKMQRRIADAMAARQPKSGQAKARTARQAVTGDLTNQDKMALMTFGLSSAAQKMKVVDPKLQAAREQWFGQLFAANAGRLKQLYADAEAEFLAQEKTK